MKIRLHRIIRDVCSSLFRRMVSSACVLALFVAVALAQDPSPKTHDPISDLSAKNLWPFDPELAIPKEILGFNPTYRSLWMEAIQHPETDLQQEIAAMFERVQRGGYADFAENADVFRKLLDDSNHPTLKVALASLLISIDDRESADGLFALLKPKQIELSQVVEPALARWDYKPIREVWRSRLGKPGVRRSHLVLAIEGLMKVRDESAVDRLLEIATDQREESALRIVAARAVGQIRSTGMLSIAQQFSAEVSARGIINRLCAVALLSRHESDEANSLLQQLSLDKEPGVAAGAWRRLLQIDSALAVTQADDCLTNNDPVVRGLVVQSLFQQPTLARIDQLGGMMDDRHPDVRRAARISLHRLASVSDEFGRRVRMAGMKSVRESPSGYRGVEQSLLLLAALDHKDVAGIAVELLEHDHPWVLVTAAWALRVLQVKETLPSMLDRASRVSNVFLSDEFDKRKPLGGTAAMDQVAHLFDAFGQMDYHEADDLMQKYIPKNLGLGPNSRPAAVTAIGKLYRGRPDPGIVRQLVARLHDQASIPPEIFEVVDSAAIALGRMKARSALKDLEQYYPGEAPRSRLSYACAWSIREITGRDFPPPVAPLAYTSGFNLEPTKARLKSATNK